MNAHVATAIDGNGAGRANQPAGSALELLFDGVDDLIRRVADTENPEIRKVRAKVHAALVAAKSEVAAQSAFEEMEATTSFYGTIQRRLWASRCWWVLASALSCPCDSNRKHAVAASHPVCRGQSSRARGHV